MRRAHTIHRVFYAAFDDDHAVVEAVADCRERGHDVVDVYGPYPLHGIDRAMGLRRSRLTWACFVFGLSGLATAIFLEYWTAAVDWPLDVGGKPLNSLPAFVPVMFELTVLFAGLGTVASLFCREKLFPGKRPALVDPKITDDQFVVVVRDPGVLPRERDLDEIWERHGAVRSWKMGEEDAS